MWYLKTSWRSDWEEEERLMVEILETEDGREAELAKRPSMAILFFHVSAHVETVF